MVEPVEYIINVAGNADVKIRQISESVSSLNSKIGTITPAVDIVPNINKFDFSPTVDIIPNINKFDNTLLPFEDGLMNMPVDMIRDATQAYGEQRDVIGSLGTSINDILEQQYGFNLSQEQTVQMADLLGKTLQGEISVLGELGDKIEGASDGLGEYSAAQQAATGHDRARTAAMTAQDAAGRKLAGTMKLVGTAMRAFSTVTMVISSLIIIWDKLNRLQEKTISQTDTLSGKIGVEERGMNKLFDAIKKSNPESERRKELLDELNAKYPGVLKNQDLMRAGLDDITEAQKAANQALRENLFLQEFKAKEGKGIAEVMAAQQDVWAKLEAMETGGWDNRKKKYTPEVISTTMDALEKNIQDYIDSGLTGGANKIVNLNGSLMAAGGLNGTEEYDLFEGLAKVMLENEKSLRLLKSFGAGRLGINADLMNAVGMGGSAGKQTNGQTVRSATEAIATGGTRTTDIHIDFRNLVENMNFSGGLEENVEETKRQMAEAFLRVLNMAQSAV